MTRVPWASLIVLLALVPSAAAHEAVEANELEIEILQDEGSDAMETTGGWDVTYAFLGEAHDPDLGFGAEGDALYFRAELYGDPAAAPPNAAPYKATFTFTTENGPVQRSIETSDGKTFKTDFDKLVANTTDGVTHVQRALILLDAAGVKAGSEVKGFQIETFAAGELRDRAPGGTFVPLVQGVIEVPSESKIVTPNATLSGPTRYASLVVTKTGADAYELRATSLLKKGDQHIMLVEGDMTNWQILTHGPTSGSVKPGEDVVFSIQVTPPAGAPPGPAPLQILTDVGGRVGLNLTAQGLAAEGGEVVDASTPDTKGVPAPLLAVPIALAIAAALARRRA